MEPIMTANKDSKPIAQAVIKKRSSISIVWIIPLVALLVGSWLMYKTLSERGPSITISFQTAEGIQAGKTKIKYKNIDIGTVSNVSISADAQHIIVQAKLAYGSEKFLHQGTRFWVAKPKITLRGITGLDTLLSGSHIIIEPGKNIGASQFNFMGLDAAPIIAHREHGKEITLQAEKLNSIDIGSPVYYRGINTGEVSSYELSKDLQHVNIHVFIKSPFDRLINTHTRFWNVSGVNSKIGLSGVKINIESLESLLLGGIAFETPTTLDSLDAPSDKPIVCALQPSYDAVQKQSTGKKDKFVVFFDHSVHGLNIGANVEFHGFTIGKVLDIKLRFDPETLSFHIPVLIEIDRNLIDIHHNANSPEINPNAVMQSMIKQGLKASLKKGNILIGALYVDLALQPKQSIILHSNLKLPFVEIPAIQYANTDVFSSAQDVLKQINKMNLQSIGHNMDEILKGLNHMVNDQSTQKSLSNIHKSLALLQALLSKLNDMATPLTHAADAALKTAQTSLASINHQLSSGSNMMNLADELTETSRSLRTLIDLIERNPNALIFGKPKQGE